MLVEVELCGHEGAWRFPGSRAFTVWAQKRPWLEDGGLCVLRTADVRDHVLLFEALCCHLRGVHGDGHLLDIRLVGCEPEQAQPLRAILDSLGLQCEASTVGARDALDYWLLDHPTVFVLHELAPLAAPQWDRFVRQCDQLRKATRRLPLCVIIIDAQGLVSPSASCDFTTGQPLHRVISLADMPSEPERWQPYLHLRASWETGGHLHRARQLSAELAELPIGDDERVERSLQQRARTMLEDTGATEILERCVSAHEPLDFDLMRLREQRLLWQPPGAHGMSVVPWAARALLARNSAPTRLHALRHALVCAPLAAEILALCLHAEAQIRAELHGRRDLGRPSQEAREHLERFSDGNADVTFYPEAHPARPDAPEDAWAFTSLGGTLQAARDAGMSAKTLAPFWGVLNLRNTVAHGHYVCWVHVKRAVDAVRRFGWR